MIKTHKELAKAIEGKNILHMNSLGKDSVLCLEWLARSARPKKVVSVFFEFLAKHPDDDRYFRYLEKRFPNFTFVKRPNTIEITNIGFGVYQSPIQIMSEYNKFEFNEFDRGLQIKDLKKEFDCELVCDGSSKYESFARRVKFHQKGLLFKDMIYPLGMMEKKQVLDLLKNCGIKLHPCYKFSKSTYDHPSWYKMRSALIANKEFRENVFRIWPLLRLDMYRYERLMK